MTKIQTVVLIRPNLQRLTGILTVLLMLLAMLHHHALAQSATVLGHNWQLDTTSSSLQFQSVKNGSKVETSSFANFTGQLDTTGLASLFVELNSVDTGVDLRNVRMRFLFFETFNFPVATITTQLDQTTLAKLSEVKRLRLPLDFELNLHGVTQTLSANIIMTQFADDQISVSSASPVSIQAKDFNLLGGIAKLQDAADVQIVPSGSVTFDFTFVRQTAVAEPTEETTISQKATGAATALETSGSFSSEECEGRFEILSRTRAINFAFASSALNANSYPLLETVVDIVNRCESMRIVVAGHTDSQGTDAMNMQLSSARADSVLAYLIENDVPPERVRAVGFGESKPLVPNDTPANRAKNRRIEFSIDSL